MELKNFFAQDASGNTIPSPTAYLYQPGTTTLATGLQNAAGSALANPFTGTSQGLLQFAAPDGNYDLRVTGAGRDFTMRVQFLDSVSTLPLAIAARDAAQAAAAACAGFAPIYYVDPATGSDSNPGSVSAPLATLTHAISLATAAGAEIRIKGGSTIKEDLFGVTVSPGVRIVGRGGRVLYMGCDKLTGTWTATGSGSYYQDWTCLFGGNSSLAGANGVVGLLYRLPSDGKWRQLTTYTRSEVASDAAGISLADTTADVEYIKDQGAHGSSYAAGFWKGTTLRSYVHLPNGVDPNTCQWMVRQRTPIPNFGDGCTFENFLIFGSVDRSGIVAPNGWVRDGEYLFPSFHALESPGAIFEDVAIDSGWKRSTGYAAHLFGQSANWAKQKQARFIRCSWSNWNGAVVGCHGTDSADGGGGAGVVTDGAVFDDCRLENCNTLLDGGLGVGAVFNRLVANRLGSLGTPTYHAVFNDPAITFDTVIDDNGVELVQPGGLGTPAAGYMVRLNGGKLAWPNGGNMIRSSDQFYGRLELNGVVGVANGSAPFYHTSTSAVATGTAASGNAIVLNGCAFDCPPFFGDGPVTYGIQGINPTANRPVFINDCHLTGFLGLEGAAGVTINANTVLGGRTGLAMTGNTRDPVSVEEYATWWGLGDKCLNASANVGATPTIFTTLGMYAAPTNGSLAGLTNTWPSTFTCNGGVTFSSQAWYAYGAGGQVKKGFLYNANSVNTVTGGGTVNFIGHFVVSSTVIVLLGDAGQLVKLDTSTDTFTVMTSPIAALGTPWPVTGGYAIDANTWFVWGANDAGTVGGMAYTTNAGTAWTISTSATATNIRCGGYVNGVIVLAGDGGRFLTGTTVGGTFTQRDMVGRLSYYSLGADTTNKQLVLLGRNIGANPSSAANLRQSRRHALVYVNAANVDPSTWTISVSGKAPLPALRQVLCNRDVFNDGASTNQWFALGATPMWAATQWWGGDEWYRSRRMRTQMKLPRIPQLAGDMAYRAA